ncbi:mannitol dehydrogenase family protein [Yoonia sp.]|uniref:mannitol dehydrogenase family protein n=1 Tax=Yoonia sp. TaxID=2212373 RepID=UPI003F6D01CC
MMRHQAWPAITQTNYDRSACTAGVVHLGYGAFHRAHQAAYLDDYMEETGDLRWGIIAVNLRAAEQDSFVANQGANGYLLKSVAPDGETALRRVRSHLGFADWSQDREGVAALLAGPDVRIVTITVTESGYYTDPAGALNPAEPVIAAEFAGGAVRSVYACLCDGLAARMQAGGTPLTILCCDNIRSNGKMLRRNLAAYLAGTGQDVLAAWVDANVTFPCSMVDRITPRSTPEMRAEIEAALGPQDATPIMAEAFVQWVLEDNFAGPMPDLAKVGVTVTPDVDPYEEAKIRILNGGHTSLTYMAALEGVATFDAAMDHPDLFDHFWRYETQEVLPGLTIKLPFDKAEYLKSISARFKNGAIADTIARICADGMAKFPIFIRPTLEGCLQQGIMPDCGIAAAASWYVFAKHVAAGRIGFDYLEPGWDLLMPMLSDDGKDSFVTSRQLWGDLPVIYPAFADALRAQIKEKETKWPV